MSRRVWWCALVLALCGRAALAQAAVEVSCPDSVVFGAPFEVEVRRTWPRGAEAEPFVEGALAPLSVRVVSSSRAEGTQGVVERLRLTARAWTVGIVEVPPVVLRARAADGALIEAAATPSTLTVRSSLPEPSGGVEWLDLRELRPASSAWWFAAAGCVLLLGGGWWFMATRRRPVAPALGAEPPLHEETLTALAALAAQAAQAVGPDAAPFHTRLAEVVRGYAARRFGLVVEASTSEELVRAVPTGTGQLRDCLAACDLVKFAALAPPIGGPAAAVGCGVGFVRASMPRGGAA